MSWLGLIDYWHWWILAVLLFVLEVLSPAAFFLWMGISAGTVGLALLARPDLSWEYQLLLFSGLSVASIGLWRTYLRKHPTKTDHPTLNRRGEQYVGRIFTLEEPVVNGAGKIRVDDSIWKVEGQDCGAGTRVQVVGVDGVVLKIEVVSDAQAAG